MAVWGIYVGSEPSQEGLQDYVMNVPNDVTAEVVKDLARLNGLFGSGWGCVAKLPEGWVATSPNPWNWKDFSAPTPGAGGDQPES